MPEKILPAEEAPALFPLQPWLWSSLAVVCFALLAVTGLGLLFFYQPTPEGARASLVELRETSDWAFLRGLHHWASHGLVIAGWLHLLRVFVVGSYRRTFGWTMTVLLFGLVVVLAWTGSLLPSGLSAGLSLQTIYVLHILVLPATMLALVAAWRVHRRRKETPAEVLPAEVPPVEVPPVEVSPAEGPGIP